jgi:Protein of unknown function (DUF968).
MTEVVNESAALDHRDRMIANDAAKDYEQIRTSTRKKVEAKKDDIRARFRWGGTVAEALEDADYGDGVAEKISNEIDKVVQYVNNHARFFNRVLDSWPDDGVEGYIQHCEEKDRNLSWRQAREWAKRPKGGSDDGGGGNAEAVQQKRRRVEDLMHELEEEAVELWEESKEARGELTDDDFEQVMGVVTSAKEKIDDTDPEKVPDADPDRHRQVIEPWRRWVESKGCIVPGCDTPLKGPTAHHLDRGGHGTKGSDTLTVCLCDPHHQILHDMPEREFWDMHHVNPWRVAAEWQSEVLDAIGDLATVLNATPNS